MPQSRPRFLVFEGLDGSGKSTLIQGLNLELKQKSIQTRLTREPGGTPLAEDIRRLLLRTDGEVPQASTELLLYAASRAQHVGEVIKPALEKGDWVLCDRFSASTVSFQSFARGLPRANIDWLNRFAEQGAQPDLYVLIDVTVDECERRQAGRTRKSGQAADRMERENRKFHESVREGYLSQAKENPSQWLTLNGTDSPKDLVTQVLSALEARRWLD
ncbi:MAG TPA: dTMP kinase [Bdellovibrionales bacterium]|nr:dTMP kinase [Bdellovibrionales bacterium]